MEVRPEMPMTKHVSRTPDDIIRMLVEALEGWKTIDFVRYSDVKDQRAAERGARRKRERALAEAQRYLRPDQPKTAEQMLHEILNAHVRS